LSVNPEFFSAVLSEYQAWVSEPVLLEFERIVSPVGVKPLYQWDRPGQGAVKVLPSGCRVERFSVLGSKRGNRVYCRALRRRFSRWSNGIGASSRFWSFYESNVRGNWVFLTYTLDRVLFSLESGWLHIRREWNRHLTWLRKRYGAIRVLTFLQPQDASGFVHLHVIADFAKSSFRGWRNVNRHTREVSWRFDASRTIASNWSVGFVDAKLIPSVKDALWYVAKYLVRPGDSSKGEMIYALSRHFSRRVWSASRSWPGDDLIRNSGNSNDSPPGSLPDLSRVWVSDPSDPVLSVRYAPFVLVSTRFLGVDYSLRGADG
jgi:hypothetical protein